MRIISAAPSNTEILYAIGAGSDIVGVTAFCNYPKEAKDKAKIGGWTTANITHIKKLRPDIVITSTFLQDKIAETVTKNGFKVLHVNPKTLNDVVESIVTIGRAVNKEKKAIQLVKNMKNSLGKLKVRKRRKVRIYIEEWHAPAMVSGNWVPKLIEMAGGTALINEGEISRKVSLLEIVKFNPQIIILSLCGFGSRPSTGIIYSRKNWEAVDAVAKKHVFVINDDFLNRPGPRLVLGLKYLVGISNLNIR